MLGLAVIALASSALSAVVGMAGGIILLACMLLVLDPLVAIPIHGVIQIVSNGSRAAILVRHVRWDIAWRYGVLLGPGAYLGLLVALDLPQRIMRGLIGVFVLCATWLPGLRTDPQRPPAAPRLRSFFLLGGAAGTLTMLVGAIGPMIAPFFLNRGLSRQEIVGTKAMCQFLGHLVKLLLFGLAGFAFLAWLKLYLVLVPMTILGTWVGSRLLERVSERVFTIIYKVALTGIAFFLIAQGFLSAG